MSAILGRMIPRGQALVNQYLVRVPGDAEREDSFTWSDDRSEAHSFHFESYDEEQEHLARYTEEVGGRMCRPWAINGVPPVRKEKPVDIGQSEILNDSANSETRLDAKAHVTAERANGRKSADPGAVAISNDSSGVDETRPECKARSVLPATHRANPKPVKVRPAVPDSCRRGGIPQRAPDPRGAERWKAVLEQMEQKHPHERVFDQTERRVGS